MKTLRLSFIALLLCSSLYCGQTQAQTVNAQMASTYTLTGYDRDYDFDVFVRMLVPTTKFFIVYTLEDGSTQEVGPISTYDMAARQIFFNYEHGTSPAGTIDAEIESRQVLEPFTKFNRYGTYLEALQIAWQLEYYGLETDIRWVRTVQIQAKLSTSVRYTR
jgi:hypothetical protein